MVDKTSQRRCGSRNSEFLFWAIPSRISSYTRSKRLKGVQRVILCQARLQVRRRARRPWSSRSFEFLLELRRLAINSIHFLFVPLCVCCRSLNAFVLQRDTHAPQSRPNVFSPSQHCRLSSIKPFHVITQSFQRACTMRDAPLHTYTAPTTAAEQSFLHAPTHIYSPHLQPDQFSTTITSRTKVTNPSIIAMSKRSAPSSPVDEYVNPKKQKVTDIVEDAAPAPLTPDTTPNASEAGTIDAAATTVATEADSTTVETDTAKPMDVDPSATAETDAPMPQEGKVKGKAKKVTLKKAGPKQVAPKKEKKEKKDSPKKPPVHEAFVAWKPEVTVPPTNPFWGIKPESGDALPHPIQPSARDSDAATNPPIWEDRGYRFKRGNRHVKYYGPVAPDNAENLPDLDQENLLVLNLIDMRPTSKHDQSPRRHPTFYVYEHGKPKDWNDMQSIKALNDRRGQAIDRITMDAPWTRLEREYLAGLCNEFPNASIWELTMRHNDRFKNRESTADTALADTPFSTGRTVESVRHQYMTYKPVYDRGQAPEGVRHRNDNSAEGKGLRASMKVENAFGKPNKALEKEFDEKSGPHEEAKDADGSDDEAVVPVEQQPKLSSQDEELFAMAGGYDDGEIRASAPALPADNFLSLDYADSPLTDMEDLSPSASPSPASPTDDEEMTEIAPEPETVDATAVETEDLPPRASSAVNFPEVDDEVSIEEEAVAIEKLIDDTTTTSQAFQFRTEDEALDDEPSTGVETVTESVEITVNAPVQVTTTATARPPSLHAIRRICLNEEYDDEEEL
ncbi:hypothetical protein CC86DRAFT_452768 [Ophiobolus disseminans]|uniref:Uncharacterized protein n=1 Tax=Ophiobolus disseminans TaxID=1469910 RepID=A0A6A7ACJ2_9PLEO|nr:hypothetical protein CC86DRAFT_452768 [Ophiobolus disseminans]